MDGGALAPLPLWAAYQLGATEIVAIDCVPRLPILGPTLRFIRGRFGLGKESGIPTLTISPGKPLGGLRALLRWDKDNIRRWIDRGRIDAATCWKSQNWR